LSVTDAEATDCNSLPMQSAAHVHASVSANDLISNK